MSFGLAKPAPGGTHLPAVRPTITDCCGVCRGTGQQDRCFANGSNLANSQRCAQCRGAGFVERYAA